MFSQSLDEVAMDPTQSSNTKSEGFDNVYGLSNWFIGQVID